MRPRCPAARATGRRISARARRAVTALHWGVEPFRSVDVVRPPLAPAELVELGRLVRIELSGGRVVVPEGGPVWLAADVELTELYLVAEGGVHSEAPPGAIEAITYDTRKDATEAHWRHRFLGARPHLVDGRIERRRSAFFIDEHGIRR